ncbi:MAG: LarC family nickel insertion protein [Pseudorhodobacter sp.]
MTRVSHVTLVPLGGLAGDMFAAALLDALPDAVGPVMQSLRAVLPGDLPHLAPVTSGGIAARRITVPPQGQDAPIHYPDLDRIIAAAALPERVATHARAILRLLAEAEAQVHRVPLDHVHFHEIADWDTLADVVAAGHLIDRLAGATWQIDPLPLGAGQVRTAHGLLPVPAPATALLIEGLAVRDDGIAGERVTPTGAAIAHHIAATLPRGKADGRMLATGYGAGTRSLPGIANVVIARLIQADPSAGAHDVTVLEFDIDDMTAEELAEAATRLRQHAQVIDLVTFPLAAKKGRTATGFRLILPPGAEEQVAAACFAQTSTIGLRLRHERRICLPRENLGKAPRVKRVQRPDGIATTKAEADDLTGATLAERRRMARRAEE